MLAGGEEGHIVNTASMAGLLTGNGSYGVTKHAVVALSEALLNQLRGAGAPVGVTVLCPGWVNTNIHDSARHRSSEYGEPAVVPDADPSVRERRAAVRELPASGFPPEDIADEVLEAIRERRFYLTPAQPHMREAVVARHRAIEEGGLPVMPATAAPRRAEGGR